jgi:hypothetical protein
VQAFSFLVEVPGGWLGPVISTEKMLPVAVVNIHSLLVEEGEEGE